MYTMTSPLKLLSAFHLKSPVTIQFFYSVCSDQWDFIQNYHKALLAILLNCRVPPTLPLSFCFLSPPSSQLTCPCQVIQPGEGVRYHCCKHEFICSYVSHLKTPSERFDLLFHGAGHLFQCKIMSPLSLKIKLVVKKYGQDFPLPCPSLACWFES